MPMYILAVLRGLCGFKRVGKREIKNLELGRPSGGENKGGNGEERICLKHIHYMHA